MTHPIVSLSAIALFVAAASMAGACSDDPPANGTTGNPDGGSGGSPADDDGGGGSGATGGSGGMGGEAGMGGMGGSGGTGGDPACSGWSECCVDGCNKLENSCGQQSLCGNLGFNCGGTAPAEPLACIIACIAADTTTCDDFDKWLDPNDAPASPSVYAQCVAACPGAFDGSSPVQGIIQCSSSYCSAEATACLEEQACSDWFATCAGMCNTPSCWQSCTQSNPSQAAAALNACLCDVQANQVGVGDPQPDWIGTAACSDILAGRMDACGL